MGIEEFNTAFDVQYNNISSDKAPSLNTYEKSVFLTRSQDEWVKNSFFSSGEGLKGFDGNQKRQIDFSMLITNAAGTYVGDKGAFDSRALLYKFPDAKRILFIINESVDFIDPLHSNKVLDTRQVIPLAYDEYTRLMNKPYKEPLKNQAWRLFMQPTAEPKMQADLLLRSVDVDDYLSGDKSNAQTKMTYNLRYIRYPKPIILEELKHYSNDLLIHGEHEAMPCELDETVHEEILQRAVELAKAAWAG